MTQNIQSVLSTAKYPYNFRSFFFVTRERAHIASLLLLSHVSLVHTYQGRIQDFFCMVLTFEVREAREDFFRTPFKLLAPHSAPPSRSLPALIELIRNFVFTQIFTLIPTSL